MNNLHELTKQLDVLTWNSRSVLNALIRSAMAAGSSDGFTVKRADEDVKLTRQDIYKLYHFYEAWEASQFNPTSFDEIRSQMNEEYSETGGVDIALATHAKVMWMDADTKDLSNDEWINQVKNYTNPKWLTNTAPIPLNIRTPIYDENLSTKTYDSYETYLFPSAYYAIDTLGHSGDGIDHSAGGNAWHYNIDDVFAIDANRVLVGTQDADRLAAYRMLYKTVPVHSFEGGTNSFALRNNSFSFGHNNKVGRDNAAIVGGFSNMATGSQSGILGGNSNIVNSTNSVVGGGLSNMIGAGPESFAANSRNSIGGYAYFFKRTLTAEASTQTTCQPVIPIDGCGDYQRMDTTTASTSTTGGIALTANQIYIPEDDTSGIGRNRISSGTSLGKASPVDFKVNDSVVLFGFKTNDGFGFRPCPSLTAAVVSIQIWTSKGLYDVMTEDSVGDIYGYIITLSNNVNSTKIDGLGDYAIQSGYVVRLSADAYPHLTEYDTVYDTDPFNTSNCSAFGYNNISCGQAQFVVGSSNVELLQPRFIVGSGSSYIEANNYHRANSLVSAPHYTYMKTSNYIVSGVATMTTAKVHGDGDWYLTTRTYDEDYRDGVEKYAGFFAYSKNHKGSSDVEEMTRAVLRVFHEKSVLAIGDNGLILREPFINAETTPTTEGTVWNELYCKDGALAIHSGSGRVDGTQTDDNDWSEFYNAWVASSMIQGQDQSVTIWSAQKTGIHGHDLQLHANLDNGHIFMNANALKIRANTRESLTAQPTDAGIEEYTMTDSRVDLITDTGHFYIPKSMSGLSGSDPDIGSVITNTNSATFHVITSSKYTGNIGGYDFYDVAQLLLPGTISCSRSARGTSAIPHPVVMAYTVQKTANSKSNGRDEDIGYIYEELAYKSDIVKQVGTLVCKNIGIPSYTTDSEVSYYKTDSNPEIPGYNKVKQFDTVLISMRMMWAAFNNLFWQLQTTYDVTRSDNHLGKVIIPKSYSGYLSNLTDCTPVPSGDYWGYFVDGVELNPAMYMEIVDANNHTTGIAYLAYGHPGLWPTSDTESDSDIISAPMSIEDRYNANLGGGIAEQNRMLHTSKYCPGSATSALTDLRDVWICAVEDKDTSTKVRWYPFIKNLIMTVAGGHLTVEFMLDLNVMNKKWAWPTQAAATTNTLVLNPSVDRDDYPGLHMGSQVIVLPVDPEIANAMQPAANLSTGVACQLTGRLFYTGNINITVTGSYWKQTPGHCFDRNTRQNLSDIFQTPCIVLNIAGLADEDGDPTLSNLMYQCKVEGVINYGG